MGWPITAGQHHVLGVLPLQAPELVLFTNESAPDPRKFLVHLSLLDSIRKATRQRLERSSHKDITLAQVLHHSQVGVPVVEVHVEGPILGQLTGEPHHVQVDGRDVRHSS